MVVVVVVVVQQHTERCRPLVVVQVWHLAFVMQPLLHYHPTTTTTMRVLTIHQQREEDLIKSL